MIDSLKKRRYLLLLLLVHSECFAWNWSGVLKTKLQSDSRNLEESEFFGKVWGSLEVYDNKSWHGGLDFVTRLSDGTRGLEAEIYQLYVRKEIKPLRSTVTAGRFQRADSLGYYALDGVDYQYDTYDEEGRNGYAFHVYGGVPRRLEDARSVSGDWLYGAEVKWNEKIAWQSDYIHVDDVFVRAGFQQFNDIHTSTRFNIATLVAGTFPTKFLHNYELSLSGTYETRTNTFEDFMVNAMLDVTENIRVRTTYELYHPREPYITFREKFYSQYLFGRQDLLRISVHNQYNDQFEYHYGFKYARRSENNDIGYGGNVGFTWNALTDMELAGELDYLELGEDKSENLYLSANYTVNANLMTGMNIALANNKKRIYGTNESAGLELNTQYRINSTLFLKLSGSYIWYSEIKDEYLGAIQLTWYLDQFVPKAGS